MFRKTLMALAIASLATSALAGAQSSAESVSPAPARSVEIVVVGSEPDFEAVRATLGPSAFARLRCAITGLNAGAGCLAVPDRRRGPNANRATCGRAWAQVIAREQTRNLRETCGLFHSRVR